MNSMIDLRNNPAARQQVQAVVRRAAAQTPSTPAPMPTITAPPSAQYMAPPEPSTSQRLQELETLRATGAVSEEEYNTKRAQILAEL